MSFEDISPSECFFFFCLLLSFQKRRKKKFVCLFQSTNKDPAVQVILLKIDPLGFVEFISLWIFIVWVTPWKPRLLI